VIFKNLFRRKGRTTLAVLGIGIGVAAIIALGAVAQGLKAGLTSMTRGSEADLVITQGGALSVILSSIEDTVATEVQTWPAVADVDSVLLGNAMLDGAQQFFVFGHDPQGFSIRHFRIVEGEGLADVRGVRGKPLILGKRAALSMDREVGDAMRLGGSIFRVVGIYETGDGFEDGSAVVPLAEAQALMLQPRRGISRRRRLYRGRSAARARGPPFPRPERLGDVGAGRSGRDTGHPGRDGHRGVRAGSDHWRDRDDQYPLYVGHGADA
jgi:ABC-type lipoprotein release transport system permease subunit